MNVYPASGAQRLTASLLSAHGSNHKHFVHRKSAQRLTASLLSARRTWLRGVWCGLVLNASRRRCCLHPSGPENAPRTLRCSTPHGVVAVCTVAGTLVLVPHSCAQRLTASLLSAPSCARHPVSQQNCAQRLTASLLSARVRPAPRPASSRVLNASRRRCCLHFVRMLTFLGKVLCSTPHGVVAVCTQNRGGYTPAGFLCSTPHGVVAVCTLPAGRDGRRPRPCSTPHGVVAVCTPRHRPPRPRSRVLNASRRRCCLHPGSA